VPYEPDSFVSLPLAIAIVVVLLWSGAWALRRMRPTGNPWGGSDCAIIRSVALGPRERLVVVRVGTKHLVIGVGSAAVSLLCELDEPLVPVASHTAKFAEVFRKAATKRWHGG
jgi:flagellar protein FliO/FliZ